MVINFISYKNSEEIRSMYTKGNYRNYIGGATDEIIEELFESLLQRYQKGLEESMKGSEFFLMVLINYTISVIKYV